MTFNNSNKASILLVDVDNSSANTIRLSLPPKYHVDILEDGQSAIEYISKQMPDVLVLDVSSPNLSLLDVSLPGLSGFETCRFIRNDLAISELPIFFVSDDIKEEDRLNAFEIGADDYLSKPVSAFELQYKIELILKLHAERNRLKEELAESYATAMTALSTAGEAGIVLNFLRSSFSCQTYLAICQEIINALNIYGVQGIVQIRGKMGVVSLSSNGVCSPFEETILNHMFGHDRLFDFSSCLSCSYNQITIVVKNLDLEDSEKIGRIKDTLALLTEGANERIISLDNEFQIKEKNDLLTQLAFETANSLDNIKQNQNNQRVKSEQILKDLQSNFDFRLMTLGLTETQEFELTGLIDDSIQSFLALYGENESIETCMGEVLDKLQSLIQDDSLVQ